MVRRSQGENDGKRHARAKGRWGARTTKAQWLLEVEPPAMMDTAIGQQYQVDDSEQDLEDANAEKVDWRDGLACIETHVVVEVDVWWC